MAEIRNVTEWSHVAAAGATKNIAIPAAQAGNTLVLVVGGGAIVTATGFTKRTTYGGGGQDSSILDKATVGGETNVAITLNGAENVSGLVYEFVGLLSFVGWSNNGSGVVPSAPPSGNYEVAPSSAVTAAAAAVLIVFWNVNASSGTNPYNGLNKLRGFGPLGHIYGEGANQPGVGAEFVWASGVADVTATGRWPVTESAGNYKATTQWVNPSGSTTAYAVQALYADTSGVPTNPAVAQVPAENSLPGVDNAFWFLGSAGVSATIAGYTDKVSYLPGELVEFRVDSSGAPFRVELFRLGYYGWESFGARRVAANITGTVESQPAPTVDGVLGSTSCNWTTNATWTLPDDATPGIYYVLFRRTDDTSRFSSHHFVVRGSAAGRVTVVIPDQTYQAYNAWGAVGDNGSFSTGTISGRSLYRHGADGATDNFSHRAYAVSWDRPFHTMAGNPNTYLWDADHGTAAVFLEAQDVNLTYLSDIDLDVDPTALVGAELVVILGHAEYWTARTYDAYEAAADAGVSMLVCSSNTALWHTRFAAADTQRRLMICYKENATRDVSPGWAGSGYDPAPEWTGTWRDTTSADGKSNTDVRRENSLTGQLFRVNGAVIEPLTVPAAAKGLPIWRNSSSIQALADGTAYATVQNTMGYEVDVADGSEGQPLGLVELNPTTRNFPGQGANTAGTTYTGPTGDLSVGFTIYRRASGALIVTTGSWRGWWGVTRWFGNDVPGVSRAVDLDWQNALLAVLHDLGVVLTPREMRPGIDTPLTDPAVGAPTGTRDDIARAYGLPVPGNSGAFFLVFP